MMTIKEKTELFIKNENAEKQTVAEFLLCIF